MSDKQIEDLVDLMFDTDMEEVMKEKSTLEYIHKLQQENKQLIEINENKQKEIDKLVCIIYKAIEYINNASYFDGSSMCANDLLEILGDKENE